MVQIDLEIEVGRISTLFWIQSLSKQEENEEKIQELDDEFEEIFDLLAKK